MDYLKLFSLSLLLASSSLILYYKDMAKKMQIPISRKFLNMPKGMEIIVLLSQYSSIIISLFVNPWWSIIILIGITYMISNLLLFIFRQYTQILSIILLIISYILLVSNIILT